MTFIYKPKDGLIGKLYRAFMNYIVGSGYIERFITFSSSEPRYYANMFEVSESLFVSEILGQDDKADEFDIHDDGIYISVGRSNRDYDFLYNAWKDSSNKLEIICDTENKRNIENIVLLDNCHGKEYFSRLAACHAVIIPLKDEKISSGQLVILQAMMFGKPVIVTRNDTVCDYVIDGVNGLIIDKNENSLKEAVCKISTGGYYSRLSQNARQTFEEQFSIYSMGMRIGKLLKKPSQQRRLENEDFND